MAFSHIAFNQQLEYGGKLRSSLATVEDGRTRLIQIRDTMTFMIDGDGSNSTQFGEVATRFGFVDNASAKAAWDELNSYLGKVTTDASVSSVDAAFKQLMNKLR